MADKRDYYEILGIQKGAGEDEIKKAVIEAEQFANEDKKRKEEVELRNHADSLIYSTEKTLKELGDKLTSEDTASINAAIDDLKKALEGSELELIKTASEKLTDVSYNAFGKIYQQQAQQEAPQGGFGGASSGGAAQNDDVVDADYEVVDDN